MEQTRETVQEDVHKVHQIDAQDEEQELLRKLIKKGVLELKPTLNKIGVHYVEVEETWKNTDSTKVKSILKNLEKKGALKSKFVDRVLTSQTVVHQRFTQSILVQNAIPTTWNTHNSLNT